MFTVPSASILVGWDAAVLMMFLIALGLLSVVLSWTVVHTAFTLPGRTTRPAPQHRVQRGGTADLDGFHLLRLHRRDGTKWQPSAAGGALSGRRGSATSPVQSVDAS